MKVFRWDEKKNVLLKEQRGVSFEMVVVLLERGEVLDILEHSDEMRYAGQKIAVVDLGGYAHLVPYVEQGEEIFLKTVIPSRKATRKYLGGTS